MLLERDRELNLLSGLLDEIESSGGRVVLVRGEAGVGKSALVEEFVERHESSAHILYGSCDDLLTPQPLGPFWDIARSEDSVAVPLAEGDRPGVLEATLALLSRSLRPSVMVVEDTQWADEATLDAVKYLGRRIADTRGLMVLTYRDTEVDYDHPLRGVVGDLPPACVVRLRLNGLSKAAVEVMIGDSRVDPDDVMAITNGNPFLVTQMVAAGADVVPSSVQDSVLAMARRLSPEAAEALKVLSVIPARIPLAEALLHVRGDEGLLAECERRGFLRVGSDVVFFRHELMRRAVETTLTASDRRVLNRRVLDSLPSGTDSARIVHHAREADDLDRLLESAPKAARAASAVESHREAVAHFRQLLDLLDRLEPDIRGPLLEDWARAEFRVENLDEAIRLNELAVRHYANSGTRSAESRALCRAAQYVEFAGMRDRAVVSARRAVDVLGGDDAKGPATARALAMNAYLAGMAQDVPKAVALTEKALQAVGPDIDARTHVRCLEIMGWAANVTNYPSGRESYEKAITLAQAEGLWFHACRLLNNQAWESILTRDLPAAADFVERAIRSAVRHEQVSLESYATATYSVVLELQGRWDRAEDLAREQLEHTPLSRLVALATVGVLEARTGRPSAPVTLGHAWEMARTADEFQRLAPVATALAELAWISGTYVAPAAELREVLTLGIQKGSEWQLGSLGFWLWKLGDLVEVPERIAAPYRQVIEGSPLTAADEWSRIGCPYERAVALTHGDRSAQLEALQLLDSLGAAAVAGKLRRSLRDQGVAVPRRKSRATREHAAGLTARQAEVLQLLAEGLSNLEIADRLFISSRTAENHVAALLAKLESPTRREAVQRARERGLLNG